MTQSQQFKSDLQQLLNRHSIDARTNTPDFVLADMLVGHLEAYELAHNETRRWHGVRYPLEQQVHIQPAIEDTPSQGPAAQPQRFRRQIVALQWTGDNEDAMVAFCGAGNFEALDKPEDDPEATAAVRESAHSTWQLMYTGDSVAKDERGDGRYRVPANELAEAYEPAEA